MVEIRDEDILLKLTNFEDNFVERKTVGEIKRDALRTVVAFANSTPIGFPAILFIGVRDDGTIEGTSNLDSAQKSLAELLANAYPPIYYLTKILQQNGKQFLALLIPGSEARPHFAGQSYIRKGSQTFTASDEQFNELIASRSDKAREILKWKGKAITRHRINVEAVQQSLGRVGQTQ